eukprot:CAMPEP_0185844142 /NCGR_PEP_ID=MMETSP1354-20130828/416_1 /TAXON_ID=708628 /ORGANISM="Erythrolobus madagascarensis, Strain CCMP3276" /LENGTH=386 /DNA_ID=CAMNT_0028543763 /DNA_START=108 /DNA_END=1268 /DNA_ORIENTATION=+
MAEVEDRSVVDVISGRDFDSDAAVMATATNDSHTYTEDIARDAGVPDLDGTSSSPLPNASPNDPPTAPMSTLTEPGTAASVGPSTTATTAEAEAVTEAVQDASSAAIDNPVTTEVENAPTMAIQENGVPENEAVAAPAAAVAAAPIAQKMSSDEVPGEASEVAAENAALRHGGGAEEIVEIPPAVYEELARTKTVKHGPFLAEYVDGTPEDTAVKLKKSKKENTFLIDIEPGAKEGLFELSIDNQDEFSKVDKVLVAINIPTLDIFTISRMGGNSGAAVAPAQANGRKFGKSKSGKGDPNCVYSYFYPAVKGFDRNETFLSIAKDSASTKNKSAAFKIPPIQFGIPTTVFKGCSKFKIFWKASDAEARKRNNKKPMQFLYPKIPDY